MEDKNSLYCVQKIIEIGDMPDTRIFKEIVSPQSKLYIEQPDWNTNSC